MCIPQSDGVCHVNEQNAEQETADSEQNLEIRRIYACLMHLQFSEISEQHTALARLQSIYSGKVRVLSHMFVCLKPLEELTMYH